MIGYIFTVLFSAGIGVTICGISEDAFGMTTEGASRMARCFFWSAVLCVLIWREIDRRRHRQSRDTYRLQHGGRNDD